MHIPSIIKVVSLSFITATAVVARPLQKKNDGVSDNEGFEKRKEVAEDPNGAFTGTDFSGPEFFPKVEPPEDKRFLLFFRRKRQLSCGGSAC
ncbi:hypothetical protein BDP27DRAFT_1343185, partial [Rhodocollybia butyracea]